ncbi:hypothetical protein TIFTF001_032779 [Ficus carica]|uniref:Uncharacterized protein n=1 Tax=Ficus carica TaxID=3494 RepID=A0AA88J6W3_FICCA|nr:hypothetical protein TIFTF001_032779 [Ficus carica]
MATTHNQARPNSEGGVVQLAGQKLLVVDVGRDGAGFTAREGRATGSSEEKLSRCRQWKSQSRLCRKGGTMAAGFGDGRDGKLSLRRLSK